MAHPARTVILGAGLSGLGAALSSGLPVYEAQMQPGGVCYSYYVGEDGRKRDPCVHDIAHCFRFEPAGGHWLFGVSKASRAWLSRFCTLRPYVRKAAVFFPADGRLVPYPVQDNLRYLDPPLRERILAELCSDHEPARVVSPSFKDWLLTHFGRSLCELFFFPFNDRYTCGYYSDIAPQDLYKSTVNRESIVRGARQDAADAGYNQLFYYPEDGLDQLIRAVSATCTVHLGHRVSRVNTSTRELQFANGKCLDYATVVSTLPLNHMVQLCGISCSHVADPATAVLVVNIGATRGIDCPPYHWVYLPQSTSGMHRVGFYSNVDRSFLPERYRSGDGVVSIYAEKSFVGGAPPGPAEVEHCVAAIVEELKDWGFIGETIVLDTTFTDPAYTWSWRDSGWAKEAICRLADQGIHQIGRYGAWRFQGMAESFEEGLSAGEPYREVSSGMR